MTELTHERCSELLHLYEDGGLSATEADSVATHLAACDECARERSGLRLLRSSDADAMTDAERNRLHAGIAAAIAAESAPARERVASPTRRSWGERWWPRMRILAAAAVVVVGFVFAANVLPGGGEDDGGGEGTAATQDTGGRAVEGAAGGDPDPAPFFEQLAAPEALPSDEQAEEEGPAQAVRQARPVPPYTTGELERLGRSQSPFTEFAAAYSVEDAGRLAEDFLERLATEAPTEDLGAAVRNCGREVLEASEGRVLPAYATYDVVAGEQALILGFVAAASDSGPLDQYQVWAWARADCDRQIYYNQSGVRSNG